MVPFANSLVGSPERSAVPPAQHLIHSILKPIVEVIVARKTPPRSLIKLLIAIPLCMMLASLGTYISGIYGLDRDGVNFGIILTLLFCCAIILIDKTYVFGLSFKIGHFKSL